MGWGVWGRGARGLGVAALAAVVLAACGGGGSATTGTTASSSVKGTTTSGAQVSTTSSPKGSTGSSAKSTAFFDIGGLKVSETVTGKPFISETYSGSPELDYSGPEGCAGQAFTVSEADFDNSLFRYSGSDAYLVRNNDVYHFVVGPQLEGGELVWDQTFGSLRILVRIGCPPPPPSGPLLPPNE